MRPIIEVSDSMHLAGQISTRVSKDDFISSEKEIPTDNLKKFPFLRIVQFAAAASVMILIGIFWHDSTMDSRVSKDVLFNNPIGKAQGTSNDECPNDSLLNLYEQGEYQILIEILSKKSQLPCVAFYEGMSYLGLKDVPKSIPLLLVGTKVTDIDVKEYAEWYLSNAYIYTHQKEKAKLLLRQIIESKGQHNFKKAATDLLIVLDKKPILFDYQ